MWVSNEREKKRINDAACGLHTASSNERETERNGQRGMWVACHIIKKEAKKGMDDAVCGLHATSSNKRGKKGMDDAACGLHAASSNERKKIKENDDTACGLHAASSNGRERKRNERHGMWVAHRIVK